MSRGDPYSPFTASGAARFLLDALERRFSLVGRVDASLGPLQRAVVAATTFRPSRAAWQTRFYRSELAFALQSRNTRSRLGELPPHDVAFQIFGLFRTLGRPYVLYLDNTHEITRRLWPEWSPYSDRSLVRRYARERATYAGAEHVFVTSSGVADSVTSFYGVPADRVTVVVGGVNFERLPGLVDGMSQARAPIVLFVGRAYAGGRLKGLDCLLEAFATVHARVPGARLRIVGTSAVRAQPGVDVIGPVNDRERMATLYATSRVFCLPSRFEAYGGSSTCEAMAHALPCVVTRVGGLPEVVLDGQTGLVVPPGDSRTLADALTRVLSDASLADELGRAGRRRVEEFLNWDAVVGRMAPALTDTCSRVRSKPAAHGDSRR